MGATNESDGLGDLPQSIVNTGYTGHSAEKYDERRFVTRNGLAFDQLEWEQLRRVVTSLPSGASVLDVGCGTGRFARRLAETGLQVTAADPSADMLAVARDLSAEHENIIYIQEEAANLSAADGTFDLVFAIRVTNRTGSRDYALDMIGEMLRVTRPGGLVLVDFVNADRPFRKDHSTSVALTFEEVEGAAQAAGGVVTDRRGLLAFSHAVFSRVPGPLLPLWVAVERATVRILPTRSSRGYLVVRKSGAAPSGQSP